MLVVVHQELWPLERLAQRAGLSPGMLRRCVELGLIEPAAREMSTLLFDPVVLPRVRKIARLHRSLGVNLAGVGVILDLLDRIQVLRRQQHRR